MNTDDIRDNKELRQILKTLFHSYSPTNETLAISEAIDKLTPLWADIERKAYKKGWNDRESDILDRVDGIYGPAAPEEKVK